MAEENVTFYRYPQEQALEIFLPLLVPHLPLSNIFYRRIQSPQNEPSRHCVFASTITPPRANADAEPSPLLPESYTLLFSDRSRHKESQVWMFNPLTTLESRTEHQEATLKNHARSAVRFLRDTEVPEAPGWPFRSEILFASVHSGFAEHLKHFAREAAPEDKALGVCTSWRLWTIPTTPFASRELLTPKPLPENFSIGLVPESGLDTVISTSYVSRVKETLRRNPNAGIVDSQGNLVAWGYIDFCGTLTTFYVLPEHRGKGFAKLVAAELLKKLGEGEFVDMGFDERVPWVQSEVADTNEESSGLMKSLGGTPGLVTEYIRIDSSLVK